MANSLFFPLPYTNIFCDNFNCRERAKWYIGRPDGPVSSTWKVCHSCAEHMLANLPAELAVKSLDSVQTIVDESTTSITEQHQVIPEVVEEVLPSDTVALDITEANVVDSGEVEVMPVLENPTYDGHKPAEPKKTVSKKQK